MSKLIKSVALKHKLLDEYYELMKWNENQSDKPLNSFNHNWLSNNIKQNEKHILSIVSRVKNEVGSKHSMLLYNTMALYDKENINKLFNELFEKSLGH